MGREARKRVSRKTEGLSREARREEKPGRQTDGKAKKRNGPKGKGSGKARSKEAEGNRSREAKSKEAEGNRSGEAESKEPKRKQRGKAENGRMEKAQARSESRAAVPVRTEEMK